MPGVQGTCLLCCMLQHLLGTIYTIIHCTINPWRVPSFSSVLLQRMCMLPAEDGAVAQLSEPGCGTGCHQHWCMAHGMHQMSAVGAFLMMQRPDDIKSTQCQIKGCC